MRKFYLTSFGAILFGCAWMVFLARRNPPDRMPSAEIQPANPAENRGPAPSAVRRTGIESNKADVQSASSEAHISFANSSPDPLRIAQLRMEKLKSFDCPDYLSISSNLSKAGVNRASLPLIASRVYADLLRVKSFEDIRHTYEERMTNLAAIEAIPQSIESRNVYIEMQERGLSTWSRIVSNQLADALIRLELEAGVTDVSLQNEILAIRPKGLIPDLGMTNGIIRQ